MSGRVQTPHRRKNIRLKGWDYRNAGPYFVTICTYDRKAVFGKVKNGRMYLNDWGQVVVKHWRQIPTHFDMVILGEFICMPNHVHMIIWIQHPPESRHALTLQTVSAERGVKSGSLGAIIGSFKSAVTKSINEIRDAKHPRIWQGRFHDHIIRNERELNAIRKYIRSNPQNWTGDSEWNVGLDDCLTY